MKLLFAMGLLFIISFKRKTNVNCEHNDNLTYGFKVKPSDDGIVEETEKNVDEGFALPKEKHKNDTREDYEEDYQNTEDNDNTSDSSSKNTINKPKVKVVKFPDDFENDISKLEMPIKRPSIYLENTINKIKPNTNNDDEEEEEDKEGQEEEEEEGEINIQINETRENKKPLPEEQGQVTKIKINKIRENKVKKKKPVFDINPKRNNTPVVGLGNPNNHQLSNPTVTPTLIHKETIMSNLNPFFNSEQVVRNEIRPSRDVSLILRKGYYRPPIIIRSRRLPWPAAAAKHKFVNHRHYHYPQKSKKKRKCKPCRKHKRKPKKNMQRNILYREKLTANEASCNDNSHQMHPAYSNHYYQHPSPLNSNYYPEPTYASGYSKYSSYPPFPSTDSKYPQFSFPQTNPSNNYPIAASNYPSSSAYNQFSYPQGKTLQYPTITESSEIHDGYSVQEQDDNAYDQQLDNVDTVPVVEEDDDVTEGEQDVEDDEAEESNIDEDDDKFDGKFGYKINITSKSDIPIKRTVSEEPFNFKK